MKEKPLVVFTLLAQAAAGAFWAWSMVSLYLASQLGSQGAQLTGRTLLAIGPLMAAAMLASLFHLGRPWRALYALSNLRSSWLSREILCAGLFTLGGAVFAGLGWFQPGPSLLRDVLAGLVMALGAALVYSMARVYRLRSVPAWDSSLTTLSFFVTALLLGCLGVGAGLGLEVALFAAGGAGDGGLRTALSGLALAAVLLAALQYLLLPLGLAWMASGQPAAEAAARRIGGVFGWMLSLRLVLGFIGAAAAGLLLLPWGNQWLWGGIAAAAFAILLAAETLGRILFYEAGTRSGV